MLRMKESNSGLVGYKLFFLQPCFLGIRGFKSHLPHYKVIMIYIMLAEIVLWNLLIIYFQKWI